MVFFLPESEAPQQVTAEGEATTAPEITTSNNKEPISSWSLAISQFVQSSHFFLSLSLSYWLEKKKTANSFIYQPELWLEPQEDHCQT